MKIALKILTLVFIVATTILSCDTNQPLIEGENGHSLDLDKFNKNDIIRPTKPIKIPDTMAVQIKPSIFKNPPDSTYTLPQDSIPQE